MDGVSALVLFNIITIILSSLLVVVVWRLSRLPSRYTFVTIQALIITLVFSYTKDILSPTLDEKLFWNDLEYLGMIFIPALVLVISLQLSAPKKMLSKTGLLALLSVNAFIFLSLLTNDYHHLFYIDTALAADPTRSFVTTRGPMFYLFSVVTLAELVTATVWNWYANRNAGIAQRRRMAILGFSYLIPALMAALGLILETWFPSEVMVVTGIIASSILLFLGTFGFEMFRLLPFTFDSTVRTLKDGVIIVDEHHRLLYSNPALPDLIGQEEKDMSGDILETILPDFPFQLLDDSVSTENREMEEVELVPNRFYDLHVSKIHNRSGSTISSLVIVKEVTEHKRLQEDKRQTRELYTTIFRSSPAAIILSRLDNGCLMEVNEMFIKLTGHTREELIGHTLTELNIWMDNNDREQIINLTTSDGQRRSAEISYRRKDGSIRVCRASPQMIELNNVKCLLTVIEDITEQQRIEERIRSNEEKFRTLFDNAGDGIYITDVYGNVIDANTSALDQLGYTLEELAGMNFVEFIDQKDVPSVLEGLKELSIGGGIFREFTWITKQGRRFPAEINGKLVTISGEKALLVISRDITERKEAERALRNEKERLDVTLNNISEGVVVTDLDGRVVLANYSATFMLDIGREDIVGKRLDDIYKLSDPANGADKESAIGNTLRKGLGSTTYHVNLRSRNWNILINESTSPIFEGEKMIGAVLAFHDVTVEKRLEDEIAKAARLRTIGTLAGGIAHDFNNVLTIIMGNIDLTLRSGGTRFDPEKWFGDVTKALERAKDLSNQLLTFSKGGVPIKKNVVLEDLVNETVHDLFEGDDLQIDVSIPQNLGKVNIDEGQMKQAMVHLLRNAREAMSEGGSLGISAMHSYIDGNSLFMPTGDYVHISIKDDGVGIPDYEVKHVFEPYFTTKQDHAGVGLTVAYSVVKAHDGHIFIESEPENGTTVHIYLPALECEDQVEEKADNTSPHDGHLRVLIMDDEAMIRDLASDMLEILGHSSEGVYGGDEALRCYADAKASGDPFDLVVMDLTIPNGMGGKEAIVELLKMDPEAKVIVSSGYSNDPVMADYRKFGFRSVMPKPYKMNDFQEAIRHALND